MAEQAGAGEHRWPIRVYYEDTDAGGVIYHANYLRFAERARTEMIRCFDLEHGALRAEHGLVFVVRRCSVDYLAPGRLDDQLEVHTRIIAMGAASLDLEQQVFRADDLLVRMEVRLAMVSSAARPARLPAPLRTAMSAWRGEPAPRSQADG